MVPTKFLAASITYDEIQRVIARLATLDDAQKLLMRHHTAMDWYMPLDVQP